MLMNEYQEKSQDTRMATSDFMYCVLGLAGEAGEVASKVAKCLRDGTEIEILRDDLKKELGDVLWMIASICVDLEINLGDVAEANLEKLNSRKDRGVIGGSGDDR